MFCYIVMFYVSQWSQFEVKWQLFKIIYVLFFYYLFFYLFFYGQETNGRCFCNWPLNGDSTVKSNHIVILCDNSKYFVIVKMMNITYYDKTSDNIYLLN